MWEGACQAVTGRAFRLGARSCATSFLLALLPPVSWPRGFRHIRRHLQKAGPILRGKRLGGLLENQHWSSVSASGMVVKSSAAWQRHDENTLTQDKRLNAAPGPEP